MIKNLALSFGLTLFCASMVLAQTPRKPLPRLINLPSKNQISPSLTGDGRTMIFMTDYSEGGDLELKITTMIRNGVWSEPTGIYTINQSRNNNLIGSYFLSYDGKTIYYTTRKAYGIGKYDIWMTNRQGESWLKPVNLGKPLNSVGNEGAPSLSPDGNTLFFMRCDNMDSKTASGCKIMMAAKRGNYWAEPQVLPDFINAASSINPKILPDNQTLIYSSNEEGGKGGYDFYATKRINGEWTQPVPLDYLNSPRDELYVSIPVRGDLAYYSSVYRDFHTLIKAQIPEELRPEKVILLEGVVNNYENAAMESYIQLYDAETKRLVQKTRTTAENGKFTMLLTGGKNYDFSITPIDKNYEFYSKLYMLDTLKESKWDKLETSLSPLRGGSKIVSHNIMFTPGTAELAPESSFELRRISKVLKNNQGLNIDVTVHIDEIQVDTIQSTPDLTELIIDTVQYEIDSVILGVKEIEIIETDSTEESDTTWVSFDGDEVVQQIEEDEFTATDTLDIVKVIRYRYNYFYHNDRTGAQAESILNYLTKLGVPPNRVSVIGKGDSENIGLNDTRENRKLNERVEILFKN